MRSFRRLVPALTLAGLALTACASDDATEVADRASRTPATPTSGAATHTPTTPTEPTEPAPAADSETMVEELVFKESDLQEVGEVAPYESGDQVDGQVTLDNCGFVFTTEPARTARRQVRIKLASLPDSSFSNEVVTYSDAVTAEKAMDEVRASMRGCDPDQFVIGGIAMPPAKFELMGHSEQANGHPVADAVEYTERVTVQGQEPFWVVATFLRAGAVLDVHYLLSPTKPTLHQIDTLGAQVLVTGTRLAQLSA